MIPNKAEHSIPVIYLVTCKVNGKIYVGSAVNFYRRFHNYSAVIPFDKRVRPFERAVRKYGINQFEFSILERVEDETKLIEREQHYLDLLKSYDRKVGYNVRVIADSQLGFKHTPDTRTLMSHSHTGKVMPESVKRKIQAANTGRLKMARLVLQIDKKTLQIVNEYRSVASATTAMQLPSETTIRDVCREKKRTAHGYYWCFKDKYVEPFVPRADRRRESLNGQQMKPVAQYTTDGQLIKVWDWVNLAASAYHLSHDAIRKCCYGKNKTSGGFKWSFVKDPIIIEAVNKKRKEMWREKYNAAANH